MCAAPSRPLSRDERLAWLRLIRSDSVGPTTFRQLRVRFGSAEKALEALPEIARRGGRTRTLRIPSAAVADQELKTVERLGARFLALIEPDYPRALAATNDAPPLLMLWGHPHLLQRPAVAIVGARNASMNGRKLAEKMARDLAAAGFLVVSDLAQGIDTAAHIGALESATAAVVAGGLHVVYPPESKALHADIRERGLQQSAAPGRDSGGGRRRRGAGAGATEPPAGRTRDRRFRRASPWNPERRRGCAGQGRAS